jgi:hypothetical protein
MESSEEQRSTYRLKDKKKFKKKRKTKKFKNGKRQKTFFLLNKYKRPFMKFILFNNLIIYLIIIFELFN